MVRRLRYELSQTREHTRRVACGSFRLETWALLHEATRGVAAMLSLSTNPA